MKESAGPQPSLRVLSAGTPLEEARAALILLHGRGGSAESIMSLAPAFEQPGYAFLAPQAEQNSWYPFSFLEPLAKNQLWLDSSLKAVGGLVREVVSQGIPTERLLILGFSQGACLGLEYAARQGGKFGGVAGLSGGLLGPPGTQFSYDTTLEGTPVFLGCSESDPHIPRERVAETASVFESLGARVSLRLYPGSEHAVNRDEIEVILRLMNSLP